MAFSVTIAISPKEKENESAKSVSKTFSVSVPVNRNKVANAINGMQSSQPATSKNQAHCLDDYIERFDESLKDEAKRVQTLYYFPLESSRHILYESFYDKNTAKSTLAKQAKVVALNTRRLQNFWSRAEFAMDELDGKIMSDDVRKDLQNEHHELLAACERLEMEAARKEAEVGSLSIPNAPHSNDTTATDDVKESTATAELVEEAVKDSAPAAQKKKRGRPKKSDDGSVSVKAEIARKMRKEQQQEDDKRFKDAMNDFYKNK